MRIGTVGVFRGYEDEARRSDLILGKGDLCVVFEVPDEDTLRVCYQTPDGVPDWERTELVFRSEFLPIGRASLMAVSFEQ